jgi:radical SAM protein with 4Fe4S-binding SPASM domain
MMELLSKNTDIIEFFGTIPLIAASVRLTKRCNLKCRHCYAESQGPKFRENEISLEEIKDLIDQFSEFSVNEIFYTGGEPLMRDDLAEILNYTSSKGIKVLMSTNGAAITEGFLQQITDVDFKLFQISIDGPEEVHDRMRGKGSFKKSIRALKLASHYIKKNLTVGTVMSKNNVNCVEDVMKIAAEEGAAIFALMFLIISGRANADMDPSAQETIDALSRLFKTYKKYENKIRFAHNTTIPPSLYPKELRKVNLHTQCALCSFPNTLAVESDGTIAPCDGFFSIPKFEVGNIRTHKLKDLWENHNVLKEVRNVDGKDLSGVCNLCKFKEFCVGGCRAAAFHTYEKLHAPDPACEKIYQAGLFPEDCMIN